jgi:hypothetical protein
MLDHHNNLRQSDISVEQTWTTQTWENGVFAFVLGITEVNVHLATRYLPMTFLEFHRMLAEALIYNPHIVEEDNEATTECQSKRQRQQQQHQLGTAPNNAHHFDGERWVCTAQQHHQKYVSKGDGCQRRIRTSCSCSKGWWPCMNAMQTIQLNVLWLSVATRLISYGRPPPTSHTSYHCF